MVAEFRPSVKRLFWPALLLVAVSGFAPWLAGTWREPPGPVLVFAVAVLFIVGGFVLPVLAWRSNRVRITERGIVREHGLFTKERTELLHSRGYQATVRRSPLQQLFRCGTLTLRAPGEVELELADMPQPLLIQAVLNDFVAQSGGQTSIVAAHGAHTTDATKRFDPRFLDETTEL